MASIEMRKVQSLDDFLEEDLPSLIKPDYENTLIHLERRLLDFNSSIEKVSVYYPNFLEKIRFHLVFFLANQLNSSKYRGLDNFQDRYRAVSLLFQDHYVLSFVEKQVQDILKLKTSC